MKAKAKMKVEFSKAVIQEELGVGGSGCKVHRCTVSGMTCAVKVCVLSFVMLWVLHNSLQFNDSCYRPPT